MPVTCVSSMSHASYYMQFTWKSHASHMQITQSSHVFPPSLPLQETLFYEQLDYYTIIGILCGLAMYNSITVYLPFPLAIYKKLLDR